MAALLLFGVLGAVAGFVVSPALEVSGNVIVILYYLNLYYHCKSWAAYWRHWSNISQREKGAGRLKKQLFKLNLLQRALSIMIS